MIEISKMNGFVVKASYEEFREFAELIRKDPVILEKDGVILVVEKETAELFRMLDLVEEE